MLARQARARPRADISSRTIRKWVHDRIGLTQSRLPACIAPRFAGTERSCIRTETELRSKDGREEFWPAQRWTRGAGLLAASQSGKLFAGRIEID